MSTTDEEGPQHEYDLLEELQCVRFNADNMRQPGGFF